MAIVMHPELEKEVDLLKTLKMIIIHDLVEIYYQDNPAHKKPPKDKEDQSRAPRASRRPPRAARATAARTPSWTFTPSFSAIVWSHSTI